MTPYYQDPWLTVYHGDCREVMAGMEPESVHCVVTSPPYWGLRDYGEAGQLGLEPTPEEYVANLVAVFRGVRRVLRADGTVWLNLGDSYQTTSGGGQQVAQTNTGAGRAADRIGAGKVPGLKPKDLVGIPWLVARALQEPYYTGRIRRERDRVWLAAMIDGEGTICGFDHDRADDGRHRSGAHVFLTNSSTALLDEASRIWPTVRHEHGRPGPGHLGLLPTFRWIVNGIANKQAVIRELYPYLIAKRQQAVVAYTLLDLMANAKRLGHSSQKDAVLAKRRILTGLLSDLNHQRAVTLPSWLVEPPSLLEPGWYLRSDIIWSKPNPMPESVTDRPTKSHEFIFLLSKSARYFFDADAVREPPSLATVDRWHGDPHPRRHNGGAQGLATGQSRGENSMGVPEAGRNIRSVWTMATQPYPGSHFATFPEALPERCIKAGTSEKGVCPECGAPWERETSVERGVRDDSTRDPDKAAARRGMAAVPEKGWESSRTTTGWRPSCVHVAESVPATVIDPFAGSGTTGMVAQSLSRRAVLIDLSLDYLGQLMARNRDIPLGLGA